LHYQSVLEEIEKEIQPLVGIGQAADYIPKLHSIPRKQFGMAIRTIDGKSYAVGDAKVRFSI